MGQMSDRDLRLRLTPLCLACVFQVLLQAQRELLMYNDTGISVLGE